MKLTGQDIHAAFLQAHEEANRPPLMECMACWQSLTERSRVLYTRMAEALNERMQEQEMDTRGSQTR